MEFGWNDDQLALRRDARAFAARELGSGLLERDRKGAVDDRDWRDEWQKCADFGVLGLKVPKRYGGRGRGVLDAVIVLEAIGFGCRDNGLTLGLNGHVWAVQELILAFGTEAQKSSLLPGLCDGSLIGAYAMTEQASGSDAFSLGTRAERVGDDYVLTGTKTYVGLAPACDIALVFASTNPARGKWGLSAFIVEADRAGIRTDLPQHKMGLRTSPMGMIELSGCRVPAENRLGPEGAGASMFQHSMEWERSFIFASHVGSMERQLDECVAYAENRAVFGRPIDEYQSVSNRLADMKLRLEMAQLLLYKAAWLKDQGESIAMQAALAKLHLSEAFVASSLDAVRINGARGYLSEAGIERDLRDAVGGVIYSGTSDIQRQVIAGLLKV